MEQASGALVARRYFEAERLAAEALRSALAAEDYERAARICMPLLEARRLKRQLAIDAGRVTLVTEPIPEGAPVKPGCYLVCPPRVGAEARAIRQAADASLVPVLVIAREPATRAGLCPVVAVGPVTVRAMIAEPPLPPAPKPKRNAKPAAEPPRQIFGPWAPPPIEWFVAACEALGDAAIAQANAPLAADRVVELHARLQSCPDHEKLHQRLMEACEQALHEPRKRKPAAPAADEFEDDLDDGDLSSGD